MSSNEIDTAGNSFLIKFKKYQFIFLFVELIFLLIASAVLSNIAPRYSSIVSTVLFLLVLLTTVFIVTKDKRLLMVSSFLVFSIVENITYPPPCHGLRFKKLANISWFNASAISMILGRYVIALFLLSTSHDYYSSTENTSNKF